MVFYKLVQNKNEKIAASYEKWYAKAVAIGTKDLDDIAEIVQRNCTVKKSDVKAVLTELPEILKDMLQDSYRVKINGLGAFKMSISSKGAQTVKDFNAAENVTGMRILFLPESETDKSTGKRTKTLLRGATVSDISVMASKKALDAMAAADAATGGDTTEP